MPDRPIRESLPRTALRAVRRGWRHVRRRLSWPNVHFVYHDAYARSLDSVPLDNRRAERLLAYLAEEGLVQHDDIGTPRRPAVRALLRVHAPGYLESLQRRETVERVFGAPVTDRQLEQIVEMQRMMVGGTILASILATQQRGVVFNLGGGLHHATRDTGMGFCLFNDVAVAIARLRSRGFSGRILVVDLDMHDGNGTRAIFARDPTVYTYSVHAADWGDTDAVASTALAIGDDVEDELLLGTLLKTLPDVVSEFSPDLVFYLAGADPAADDVMGNWRMTAAGLLSRDRFVMGLVRSRRRPLPVVVTLAGGYGDRAWQYTARFAAWLLTGRTVDPTANDELLLQRFRRIRNGLDHGTLTSDPAAADWRLTEEDLIGVVPNAPARSRFLDYFSPHGVELVLERFGILDQLRARGYEQPCVVVDLAHPLGQTLRIFGDADRVDLLMELRVDRSVRAVPDCEVIVIEWLLLQNPRAHFGPYRQPLPGQKHPGLGMLKDVLGWLVVVCEMLGLDGIYYAPSSYHVAAQSRHRVRFLEPAHEARYRALGDVLDRFPLDRSSTLISNGRIVEGPERAPFEWRGFPMVLPVSQRLKDRVFGEHYEEKVSAELGLLDLRLADGDAAPARNA